MGLEASKCFWVIAAKLQNTKFWTLKRFQIPGFVGWDFVSTKLAEVFSRRSQAIWKHQSETKELQITLRIPLPHGIPTKMQTTHSRSECSCTVRLNPVWHVEYVTLFSSVIHSPPPCRPSTAESLPLEEFSHDAFSYPGNLQNQSGFAACNCFPFGSWEA